MLDKYLGDLTGEEGEQRMSQLPATEQRNPASAQLDEMPTGDIVRLMNEEDRKVPEAVGEALPRIAEAVDLLVNAWKKGGRWVYVGAGTSGRIVALDAAECPPTFGVPPDRVIALLAGGRWRSRGPRRKLKTTAPPPFRIWKPWISVLTMPWSGWQPADTRRT
jgi:hypothetical protein